MLKLLIEKELKSIIQSPKFVATFGVCTILILLSFFIGIKEFQNATKQYETATELVNQHFTEVTSFYQVENKVYREPDPMQIFVSGVNNDVGRQSRISSSSDIKLQQSSYSTDPLFAVFRFIDFTFIVQVVLSLFAILFTYDAVNGERESGTLKLALSNAVPRGKYLFAKFVGSWLGLTIPLTIPVLIGVLLIFVFRVPVTGDDWLKIVSLFGVSLLYFTFFIALGLLVSSMTRRSSVSFLLLLVLWINLVLIVPRAASMAAGQLVDVPSVPDIEAQKERYRTDQRNVNQEARSASWRERMSVTENMEREDRSAYFQNNRSAWEEEDQAERDAMEDRVAEYNRQTNEGLRNAKMKQERMAFTLSRLSPAAAYQLAAMNLGGTNTSIKSRYEDQMFAFRDDFNEYTVRKQQEERDEARKKAEKGGGRRMMMIGGGGSDPIDASDRPGFAEPRESISAVLSASIVDFGLLSLFTVLAFVGALVAFLRYDVR